VSFVFKVVFKSPVDNFLILLRVFSKCDGSQSTTGIGGKKDSFIPSKPNPCSLSLIKCVFVVLNYSHSFSICPKAGHLAGVKTGQTALFFALDLQYAYSNQKNLNFAKAARAIAHYQACLHILL
jgi:hypothetical protein